MMTRDEIEQAYRHRQTLWVLSHTDVQSIRPTFLYIKTVGRTVGNSTPEPLYIFKGDITESPRVNLSVLGTSLFICEHEARAQALILKL
jgi:hypothetical protein